MQTLSILIPHFNDARIFRLLDELVTEPSDGFEIVIKDGGSNEAILHDIKARIRETDKLILKEDKGIFDGINQGIEECAGEYILTLGADDFVALDTIKRFIASKPANDLEFVTVKMFDANGIVKRLWRPRPFHKILYALGAQYPHFGVFIKRAVYDGFTFNAKNKINADYEFFADLLERNDLSVSRKKEMCIYMQLGGTSTKDFFSILRHQKLIMAYILKNRPYLIAAPFLKLFFKVEELILAKVASEKVPY